MLSDLRYSARTLLKSPAFTAIAVLTLALGIGANSAIFSVVNAVVLRALPFKDPDKLVFVYEVLHGERQSVSPPNFRDVRSASHAFTDMSAVVGATYNLTGRGQPERLSAVGVSAGFFSLLGVGAELGRTFTPDEDSVGAARVVVLSHGLWQRRFDGDRRVIGQVIVLDGQPHTVIGIAPAGFTYPRKAELWTPLVLTPGDLADGERGAQYLRVIGRLRPGVLLADANRDLGVIGARFASAYPKFMTDGTFGAAGMQDRIVGEVRPKLLVLLGAVGFVLLIACANVANLMLVRSAGREHEVAIRTALGASRRRLVRQLLTESVMLSLAGGILGVLVAQWGMDLLTSFGPRDIPRLDEVRLDGVVLLVTTLTAVVTGLLFGLAPAIGTSRPDLVRRLREGGRGLRSGPGSGRLRSGLVVAETALALVLLAGAGLLIHSFYNLERVDPGFRTDHVLMFSVSLPDANYPNDTVQREAITALRERVRALPGVTSASIAFGPPLSGIRFGISYDVVGRPPTPPGQDVSAQIRPVTPEYFATMGVPLMSGRGFTDQDRGSPQVVIVNREFVRRTFPHENPLGQHITLGWTQAGVRQGGEIVGVVGDVKQFALDQDAEPDVFLPLAQCPVQQLSVVLRTRGDPLTLVGPARAAVHAVDPDLPIFSVASLEQMVDESVAQPRFYMMLLAAFAVLAVLLAAIGLYGVIAYGVAQRQHEIGVRMALGARPGDVLGLVVRQGMSMTGVGVLIGVALSLAMSRVMASLLFGVSSRDTITFALVLPLLGAVAFLACWLPARRAARVDPAVALRAE
ncbi:MAG TPA: ABC transporter permease [Gemmatimonadaceae bacterium]|nr:ABC transporter permease [Gemmatimonadaceae bacterium]